MTKLWNFQEGLRCSRYGAVILPGSFRCMVGWLINWTAFGGKWSWPTLDIHMQHQNKSYKSSQYNLFDDRESNHCANLLASHPSVGSAAREPLDAHIYSRYGKCNDNRKLDKEWLSLDSIYPVSNQNRHLALVWHFVENCSILQFCLGAELQGQSHCRHNLTFLSASCRKVQLDLPRSSCGLNSNYCPGQRGWKVTLHPTLVLVPFALLFLTPLANLHHFLNCALSFPV